MNDDKDKFEDPIELMDYLRVIWKWKYLILVGTAVCALVAVAISISMPKIFRIEMILRPAVAEISASGEKTYVYSPTNIKSLIEGGSLNSEIIQQLKNSGTRNVTVPLLFMVDIPANTDLLKIAYETKSVDEGIVILDQLIKSLSKEGSDKIDYFKTKYDKKMEEKKSLIYLFKEELRLNEVKISNIEKRLSKLVTEIQKVDNNTVMMANNRDKLVNSKSQNDVLAGFLYMNTFQQNLDLINKINNQILDYTSEMEKEKSNAKRIQIKINILSKEIEDLKQEKNEMQSFHIVQPATSSPYPIRPRIKRDVVFAAVMGFFLMLLLTFFLEYLSKYKQKGPTKNLGKREEE